LSAETDFILGIHWWVHNQKPDAISAWAREYEDEKGKPATPTSLRGWVGRKYGVWLSRKLLEEVLAPKEAEPEISIEEATAFYESRIKEVQI
jgi:hypothetical protein